VSDIAYRVLTRGPDNRDFCRTAKVPVTGGDSPAFLLMFVANTKKIIFCLNTNCKSANKAKIENNENY